LDRLDLCQSQKDVYITRLFEARRPFLDLQLKLYTETAQVAAKLAVANLGSDDWQKAVFRFCELYWSELAVVEDKKGEAAMVKVGDTLGKVQEGQPRQILENPVLALARALRDGLSLEWGAHIGTKTLQIAVPQKS
jgi:hypothetical protein